MKKIKVLFVDDEKDFVTTLAERSSLRDIGSEVAFDGEEALRKIEQDTPDVMVLDLRMPGKHGLEVLEEVKKKHPEIQVILLTGHGSEKDEEEARRLGAYEYYNKPVDFDRLMITIKNAYQKGIKYLKQAGESLDDSFSAAAMAQAGSPEMAREILAEKEKAKTEAREQEAAAAETYKVLFVDDEEDFVKTLAERMETRDLGGDVALDGEKALAMMEAEPPEVVVLDLRLPGIGGLEILERVKKKYLRTEVIILTAFGTDENQKAAMQAGAFKFMEKPVDINELVVAIRDAGRKARG